MKNRTVPFSFFFMRKVIGKVSDKLCNVKKSLLVVVFCLSALLIPCDAFCFEGWIGTITYRDEIHDNYSSTDNNERCNSNFEREKSNKFEVTINVCFSGENTRLENVQIEAEANLEHSFEQTCKWQQNSECCWGEKRCEAALISDKKKGSRWISPGASGKDTFTSTQTIIGPPTIREVSLYIDENGKYILRVRGCVEVTGQYKYSSFIKYACSGEYRHEPVWPPYKSYPRDFDVFVKGVVSGNVISDEETLTKHTKHVEPFPDGCLKCNAPHYTGCGSGDETIHENKITHKITTSWHLTKSECFGVITYIKGDVEINDQKAKLGYWAGLKGNVIKTGPKSRVKIVSDAFQICLGPNASIELKDPCKKEETSVLTHIKGLIHYLIYTPSTFEVTGGWGGSGVRGKLHPFPEEEIGKRLLDSLTNFPFSVALAKENELEEFMPDEREIEEAKIVFIVDRVPNKSLYVKVIKGVVILQDSSGYMKILEAGQTFMKEWKLPVDPSELKEIFIKVNPAVPIINSFLAYPPLISIGASSALVWSVTDATSVTIDNAIGSVALTGITVVNPTTSTTYTLTATNSAGSVTALVTVTKF